MNNITAPEPIRQFCVLAYIPTKGQRVSLNESKILAFATLSNNNEAAIRVHPAWEKIVQPDDREYLDSLYQDFRERMKSDPVALLGQLSGLAVGPLVTRDSGSNLSEFPAYLGMWQSFREL